MCGFAGLVHQDPSYPISVPQLVAMRDSITHRGPDDAGHFVAPGIGLGSRRLAILDLSERGHMPMSTPDRRYHIAYNGEVYNYRELRPALESRGCKFQSNTDTEVLLYLYATEGPAMLDRLNGMFAFAIWDAQERTLFLARDRLGIKPLYYAFHENALYFASEEKALFTAGIKAEFDASVWEELLCFRYVAGERTPFVGVKRLLPGHYMTWKNGRIETKRWWHLGERAQALRSNIPTDAVRWYQELFDSSVALRRISDVPIGVLLSGGLDSSSVAAALAMQAGSGVSSFTMRFQEASHDEGPLARQVAERYHLDAHELYIPSEQLLQRLQEAAWFNDEPLAHASDIHVAAISRYAKSRVTVLLSGEGSDEVLGGYVRYQPLRHPLLLKMARPILPRVTAALGLKNRLAKLGRFLDLGSLDQIILFNACNVLPRDLESVGMTPTLNFAYRQQMLGEARAVYPGEPMRQAMYSDQHTFLCSLLDRNDRMTMGASIECRVPFLDYRLVEGLAALPSSALLHRSQTKHLLRAGLGNRLPEAITSGRKWGFGVPWGRYFRQAPELRAMVKSLPAHKMISESPLDLKRLQVVADKFLNGEDEHEALISQLMMVAIWRDAYFERLKQKSAAKPLESLARSSQ